MFGGEDKIPAGVRDAMKLQDYGKGRPLTARRILAVKNAIDASGVLRQKAFDESISKFQDQAGMEKVALAKGYSKAELPRLAAAANLYARATGCSEADALEQVSTPGSKGNRLMNYGGRFLQSADNFKNGLRLLDSFGEWFAETGAKLAGMRDGQGMVYEDGLSNKTLLNAFPSNFAEKYKGGKHSFTFNFPGEQPIATTPARGARRSRSNGRPRSRSTAPSPRRRSSTRPGDPLGRRIAGEPAARAERAETSKKICNHSSRFRVEWATRGHPLRTAY